VPDQGTTKEKSPLFCTAGCPKFNDTLNKGLSAGRCESARNAGTCWTKLGLETERVWFMRRRTGSWIGDHHPAPERDCCCPARQMPVS